MLLDLFRRCFFFSINLSFVSVCTLKICSILCINHFLNNSNCNVVHDEWIIILDYIVPVIHYLTPMFHLSSFLLLLADKMIWKNTQRKNSHLTRWSVDLYGMNKMIHFRMYTKSKCNWFLLFYCFRVLFRVIECLLLKNENVKKGINHPKRATMMESSGNCNEEKIQM